MGIFRNLVDKIATEFSDAVFGSVTKAKWRVIQQQAKSDPVLHGLLHKLEHDFPISQEEIDKFKKMIDDL